MLKKIKIINFQSHKKTILRLSKGVNGIIGLSQSGKTAIIRALNLIRFNRPSGTRFINNEAEEAKIEVVLEDNSKVKLTKKRKGNDNDKQIYNANGTLYSGFGRSVPDKVINILNLTELNFQNQLDTPFLITSAPSEVSRVINEIIKIDDANFWVKDLVKQENELKTQANSSLEKVKAIRERLKIFDKLDNVKAIVDKVEKHELKKIDLSKKIDEISYIVQEIEKLEKKVDIISKNDLSKYKVIVNAHTSLLLDYENFAEKERDIKELLSENNKLEDVIAEKDKAVKEYIDCIKSIDICPICKTKINQNQIEKIKNEISINK